MIQPPSRDSTSTVEEPPHVEIRPSKNNCRKRRPKRKSLRGCPKGGTPAPSIGPPTLIAPETSAGPSEQTNPVLRFKEIAAKISCAMALMPSRRVDEVIGEAVEFLQKLLAASDATFFFKVPCEVRVVLAGKSPKFGVNTALWKEEDEEEKLGDY